MKEAHRGSKVSNQQTLLSSKLRLKKKSSPSTHSPIAKKKKRTDAQNEILRNTAINSFLVDDKPTKQSILVRMKELKAREKKQREIAACHNLMLQMRKLLPAFEDEDGEYVEEEDGDYEEEEGGEEDDEGEGEQEEGEEDGDEEEGESNGTVEDLDELGDDESYEARTTTGEEEDNSQGLV